MKNYILHGDNLHIMGSMKSGMIDLIYLDPPFNSGRNYWYVDTWTSDDDYLNYMKVRLKEMHRLLKPTGSIYLHCDPAMSHYLKVEMDKIFGKQNFRNEIVWCYTGPGSPKMRQFNRKHDIIFWYSKGEDWTFNKEDIRLPYAPSTIERGRYDSSSPSTGSGFRDVERGKVPESWWVGIGAGGQISKNEITKYPTQKPLKLLERIVKASSNEGDMVLDPFCGSGTTLQAAKNLGRFYMGIDANERAIEISKRRLVRQQTWNES